MTNTHFWMTLLTLTFACGGAGSADNPDDENIIRQEGEAEAEAEAESEGEDGKEAESVGDCNMYSFAGTWRGALNQSGCAKGGNSPTFEQCCLCCPDINNLDTCCSTPWEQEITATLDHGSFAWYEYKGGWREIQASATLELSIGGQTMSCSGVNVCGGGYSLPDVFCTEDRASCLTDGPTQDPPILPETCQESYTGCMERLPSQIGFRFEDCQSPKSDPFVGDLWHIWLNVSDISVLHGGVCRLICESNPNLELMLTRDP